MKWKKSKIVQWNGTVHSKKEVKHQGRFQNHIGRQFGSQIFISLPAVRYTIQIEFWSSYKLGSIAHMPFQDRNGVVQGESKSHGEKRKEDSYIVYKIIKTTTLYTLIGKPITHKKNNGT